MISSLLLLVLSLSGSPLHLERRLVKSIQAECQIVHDMFLAMDGDTISGNPFGAPSNTDCCIQTSDYKAEHGIRCDSDGHITTIDWFCGIAFFNDRNRRLWLKS
jgi:hypothetical protein